MVGSIVTPAQAGVHNIQLLIWIPACAGMTPRGIFLRTYRFLSSSQIVPLLVWLLVSLLPIVGRSSIAQASQSAYWVFLRDREPESWIPNPESQVYLDPHALERRRIRGVLGETGAFDLPVSTIYKQAILALPGISLRTESRWLNALSVTVDSSALNVISKLDFVRGVQPVARLKRADYRDDIGSVGYFAHRSVNQRLAECDRTQPDPGAPLYRMDRAWYGPSLNQVRMVNALEAHFRGNHGAGVRIAVLDGGFRLAHEAFQGLDVIAQYDFINDDDNPDYDPSQDVPGQANHGTACMSVIGGYSPGNLIGLAHEASFILCKTEDDAGETIVEEDNWVRALEWVEALGADVLSSSLSYKDWYTTADLDGLIPITSRAAQIAYDLGMVLCTSAGNEGPDPMTLGAPTDAEGVLSIGALRPNGDLADFSSRGPTADGRIKPDICAQGVRTACVRPGTWDEYAFWNGTSLSCPVAAGCMALLLAEHPDWTPAQIYEATRETASHANRPDNDWGWGLVNLEEAIHYPSVSGWVLDKDGRGWPGVELRLYGEEQALATFSDEDGFYRFSNLSWGTIRLQAVWSDGKTSPFVTLMVPPSEDVDISAQSDP